MSSPNPLIHQRRLLLQGISSLTQASLQPMQTYGTDVAAVVEVGHGGETWQDIPVFDLVEQAIAAVGTMDTSLIFVSPDQVADAALEAIAAGVRQLVLIPRNVPPLDTLKIIRRARTTGTVVLGAGSAGLIVPDRFLLGTLNPHCYCSGAVGLLSRTTAALSEAIAWELTQAGIGQSVAVHLGVGNILGSTFADWLPLLEQNEDTQVIVLLEQHLLGNDIATDYIEQKLQKPVLAYIAGQKLPVHTATKTTMPTASHKIQMLPHTCTAKQKVADYKQSKIRVARSPQQLTTWLQELLTNPTT